MTAKARVLDWLERADFNNHGCSHSQLTIAIAVGCCRRTVIRALCDLESEGRVTVDRPRKRGVCNTYRVRDWNPHKRVDVLNRLAEVRALRARCHTKENSSASGRPRSPRKDDGSVDQRCGRARASTNNERNSMPDAILLVRARLEEAGCNPKGPDHKFEALCPAHDDHKASLGVVANDRGVGLRCLAGCDTAAVVAQLGIRMTDLFNDAGEHQRSEIVATYDYTDELGHVLYQAVRFQPKDFRQRRPDGRGGWVWKLGDTRRVLYRLPNLYAAAGTGEPVYVVEGEKDVHAIEKAGGTATTNVGGAAKWRREYGEALRGADVLIVADRDSAGFDHARRVSLMLAGYAASRRIVVSVVGKDAHDHLTAGYGLEALEPIDGLARNADGWIPCPWCGQTLVEEVDGTHCGSCRITWWGER